MKIGLVNLPWYHANRPCMPIAVLAPYLRKELPFATITVHSENAKVWKILGEKLFLRIAEVCFSVGEALYGVSVHPERRESGLKYAASELSSTPVEPYLLDKHLYIGKSRTWETTVGLVANILDHYLEEFADYVAESGYDLIGLTTTFGQLYANLRLAKLIKERSPSTKVVLGGSTVSASVGPTLLKYYPFVDFIVQGEGEQPLTELARQIHSGEPDFDKIVGVLTQQNYTSFPRGAALSEIKNMDDLPFPDFEGLIEHCFDSSTFGQDPVLTLESSRGCWWDRVKASGNVKKTCHFCNLNVQWNGYKEKSIERVVAEVKSVTEKYGISRLLFIDNIIRLKGIEDLAGGLQDLGKDLSYFYEMRASISQYEFLRLWESGLNRCQIGIESLSNSYLRRIGKGTTVIQNLQMMKLCAELGVNNESNIMWDFPGATVEEVSETADNIKKFAFRYQILAVAKYHLGIGSTVDHLQKQYPIKNIRNYDSYKHFVPDDVYENGRFFDLSFDWDGPGTDWQPALEAITWWAHDIYRRQGRHPLWYADVGTSIRIGDSSHGKQESYAINGIEGSIYRYCMQIRRLEDIEEKFKSQIDRTSLVDLLKKWHEETILYNDGTRYLSLAVAIAPQTAQKRIRQLHLEDLSDREKHKSRIVVPLSAGAISRSAPASTQL